jgi:hypothetical protein
MGGLHAGTPVARKAAEMHRHRLLRGAQGMETREERGHLRPAAGHLGLGDTVGAGGVAGEREDEGLDPPCGAVVATQLGIDHPQRRVAMAADGERQSQAAAQLRIVAPPQRGDIILLGAARVADHVEGEAAVGEDLGLRSAQHECFGKQRQRRLRLAELNQRRSHPRLDPRIARGDLVGAPEKGERRIGIAHF